MRRHDLLLIAGLALGLGGAANAAPDEGLETPGGMRSYAYDEAMVFAVLAMPGRVTDIELEPGESLTGPLAAGDTARWILGDTVSGAGTARRIHVLVKPTSAPLATNLVITTDRRTYHLELRGTARTWLARVTWRYRSPDPIVVAAAPAAPTVASSRQPAVLNFGYQLQGDRPSWRPLRVYDDGARTYVEFAEGTDLSALPPLYALGADGRSLDLVAYHVSGRRLTVERLLDRAELRLGVGKRAQRVRIVRLAQGEARR